MSRVVQLLGDWCELLPSDEPLLTRVFRENPKLYSGCSHNIRRLEYVARVAFSHDGLQIPGSSFIDNKQFALLAVQQNGLALKHVSSQLQGDIDVVTRAVQQNGLALAWVRRSFMPTRLTEAAVRQNPAAAAFVNL